jgi:hypothetical protein
VPGTGRKIRRRTSFEKGATTGEIPYSGIMASNLSPTIAQQPDNVQSRKFTEVIDVVFAADTDHQHWKSSRGGQAAGKADQGT